MNRFCLRRKSPVRKSRSWAFHINRKRISVRHRHESALSSLKPMGRLNLQKISVSRGQKSALDLKSLVILSTKTPTSHSGGSHHVLSLYVRTKAFWKLDIVGSTSAIMYFGNLRSEIGNRKYQKSEIEIGNIPGSNP